MSIFLHLHTLRERLDGLRCFGTLEEECTIIPRCQESVLYRYEFRFLAHLEPGYEASEVAMNIEQDLSDAKKSGMKSLPENAPSEEPVMRLPRQARKPRPNTPAENSADNWGLVPGAALRYDE